MMATPLPPIEVFCSYAPADGAWYRRLESHLSLLQRQGLISLWHRRLIVAGTDWSTEVDTHLEQASVILLLVSADFLASDYCYGYELKRALERHAANEARVIPILLRAVDWTDASFAHLQPLPTDAKPIALWKDKDTALADVAAGLRRVMVEELPFLQASAPRASLPAIWTIPYPRNPFFLGRDADLSLLHQLLHAGQVTALSQPQAVSGLGGIGKTQLALEYAYRYHLDYQAVLWASAESAESLLSSYVALAHALHLPERDAKEQEQAVQAVKRWLQTHQDWLLVLDNADELAALSSFVPPVLGGHLLLTTRAVATGGLARRIELSLLTPEQGALLLLRRSGRLAPDASFEQAPPGEQALAIHLSTELGGLPLALDQAGAYLEETGTSLAEYGHLYEQYQSNLLQRRGGVTPDHPLSVATTWLVSFQRVETRNPAAADLLRLLAWLSADAIAEEILGAGASYLGPTLAPMVANGLLRNQAIEALRAYSLIRRDLREQMLSIHRLVQAVLRERQDENERRLWSNRAMQAVNAAFPHVEYETWELCERLLPQALGAAQKIEQEQMVTQEAGRLLFETASYLQDRGRYTEAEPLYQQALAIREQQLGPLHPHVAYSLNGLAILYFHQCKYEEAEPLFQRALHILEEQLGPLHLQIAYPLNNLANVYFEQNNYAEAEPLYLRALAIREQQLSPLHPLVIHPLNNLANLYREQGKYVGAEPLYLRALAIVEQQLGSLHPTVAYPLNGLAELYRRQEKYAEAEPLFQRALHIWERQLGPQHPHVAHPLNNLANLYYSEGKYEEAEPLYLRTLAIVEQQLGPQHPNVAYPLNSLANVYYLQSRYGQAESLYQRALAIREQQLGPQHPDTAETLHDLAAFRERQGNRQEARALYQHALSIREQALGSENPQTIATRQRLNALEQSVNQEGVASPQDDPSAEQSDGSP